MYFRSEKYYSSFLYKIVSFVKYELFNSLSVDFIYLLPHLISFAFSLLGIYAFTERVLWLMIVSAIVALATRSLGFFLPVIDEYDSFRKFLNSFKLLLAVIVVGFFLAAFLLKAGFFYAVFLSLNASILLIYVLNIPLVVIPVMIKNIMNAIRNEIRVRNDKKAGLKAALKAAGLKKNQVKDIQIHLRQESPEKWLKFYYEVTFRRGDKTYSYKHYHR